MIIGQPGSGKSSLAQVLGRVTGLQVVHIAKLHRQSGWVERSDAETTRLCREAEAQSAWVFEGGHSATWRPRVERADMLVVIERSVGLRVWRVLRRTLAGLGRTRPDMAERCPERLRSLPEFIRYIWVTRHSAVTKMRRLAAGAPVECEVVYLRSDHDVASCLRDFRMRLAEPPALACAEP